MNTSTRLILLLTVMVGAVMMLAGYFILRQREAILMTAMHNEMRAHALTLQIALEDNYRAGRISDAQRLIDRLSENPKIYSVILFDVDGRVAMLSNPLTADEIRHPLELPRVMATGETIEVVRRNRGEEVFSIIMPIRVNAERRGAFEISQPMSIINADFARARRDIALITLVLFATICLVVLAVTRRSLLSPIKELLGGAAALGRGDLDYRVIVPEGGSEFTRLAREFNRMADSLAEQKSAATREAEERLALERELRQNERLASVGRLAAGVAHEMGAPLNVIKGRVEMLKSRLEAPLETRQRNLDIIGAQADHITRIVRELLTLARPFHLRCETIGLAPLIAGVIELIEPDAKNAEIRIETVNLNEVQVSGDQDLLHQVLMNICVNGLQAMRQGGRLRIEVIEVLVEAQARRFVALRISDTGPGIAPEHLGHLFDPFFTTKDVGEGTGLGLAVSHRIIEEHRGWIEVANQPEGGAAFTIYLPQAEMLPQEVAAAGKESGENL